MFLDTHVIREQIAKPDAESFDNDVAENLATLVEGVYLVLEEKCDNEESLSFKDIELLCEDMAQWIISTGK